MRERVKLPQGLKPAPFSERNGTAEAVPLQDRLAGLVHV
jgi:hypothetical protein